VATIWQDESGVWRPVAPAGFTAEKALHEAVFAAPDLLPLAGSPRLAVLGKEVSLGSGYADVMAVELSGRPVLIEVKLAANAEARRAVVAQILAYAAALQELSLERLEVLLAPHLGRLGYVDVFAAASAAAQAPLDSDAFGAALEASLESGEFRLVLVLDEAPAELVRLVGYFDRVAPAVLIDLVAVAAFEIDGRRILVPQRLDPGRPALVPPPPGPMPPPPPVAKPQDGADAFAARVAELPIEQRPEHQRLLRWAVDLEAQGLARLYSTIGSTQDVLQVRVPGDPAGLVTIWNYGGRPSITVYGSAVSRRASGRFTRIGELINDQFNKNLVDVEDTLLEELAAAYREASGR
jgi:hypothetical protein